MLKICAQVMGVERKPTHFIFIPYTALHFLPCVIFKIKLESNVNMKRGYLRGFPGLWSLEYSLYKRCLVALDPFLPRWSICLHQKSMS